LEELIDYRRYLLKRIAEKHFRIDEISSTKTMNFNERRTEKNEEIRFIYKVFKETRTEKLMLDYR
jgi:hypothetical protein